MGDSGIGQKFKITAIMTFVVFGYLSFYFIYRHSTWILITPDPESDIGNKWVYHDVQPTMFYYIDDWKQVAISKAFTPIMHFDSIINDYDLQPFVRGSEFIPWQVEDEVEVEKLLGHDK